MIDEHTQPYFPTVDSEEETRPHNVVTFPVARLITLDEIRATVSADARDVRRAREAFEAAFVRAFFGLSSMVVGAALLLLPSFGMTLPPFASILGGALVLYGGFATFREASGRIAAGRKRIDGTHWSG